MFFHSTGANNTSYFNKTNLCKGGIYPFLFAACLLALSASTCKRNSFEDEIVLPLTRPLSRYVIGYGVVNANYTHILDKQGDDGKSIGFLRRGAVVEILERRPVLRSDKAEIWVLASGSYKGWLKESELRVYPSRAQAQTASESIP
ncbi:MAG: hypothetical protein LBD44_03030 [Spirochaetaceae bacterium]|jgi:hypothetical protein|nr:hypothetical protein [Spirochaetaceae bacterium]